MIKVGFALTLFYVLLSFAAQQPGGASAQAKVDGLCTDPNLLALYIGLDAADDPRYVYKPPDQRPYSYPLPVLPAGKPIGVARNSEVVVAIVDTGSFMDPARATSGGKSDRAIPEPAHRTNDNAK